MKADFRIVAAPENLFSVGGETRRSFLNSLTNNLVSAVASQLPTASEPSVDEAGANRRVPKKVKLIREMLEIRDVNFI